MNPAKARRFVFTGIFFLEFSSVSKRNEIFPGLPLRAGSTERMEPESVAPCGTFPFGSGTSCMTRAEMCWLGCALLEEKP